MWRCALDQQTTTVSPRRVAVLQHGQLSNRRETDDRSTGKSVSDGACAGYLRRVGLWQANDLSVCGYLLCSAIGTALAHGNVNGNKEVAKASMELSWKVSDETGSANGSDSGDRAGLFELVQGPCGLTITCTGTVLITRRVP